MIDRARNFLNRIRKNLTVFSIYKKQIGLSRTIKKSFGKITGTGEYRKELDTLFYLLNHYVDITKIPPAKGSLRKVQLCDAVLLSIFDAACEKAGLTYCLAYGTLIGAVRHKGFIPWDDDMDVFMPRKDYDQVMKKLPEIFNTYGSDTINVWYGMGMSGINYKPEQTGVMMDIFPVDFYETGSDDEEEAKRLLLGRIGKYQSFYYNNRDKLPEEVINKKRDSIINAGGGHKISVMFDGIFL